MYQGKYLQCKMPIEHRVLFTIYPEKKIAKIYWKCWKEDKSDPENVMTEKANLIGNWKKKLKNNQGSKEFHAEALSFFGALYSGVDAGFGES